MSEGPHYLANEKKPRARTHYRTSDSWRTVSRETNPVLLERGVISRRKFGETGKNSFIIPPFLFSIPLPLAFYSSPFPPPSLSHFLHPSPLPISTAFFRRWGSLLYLFSFLGAVGEGRPGKSLENLREEKGFSRPSIF